MDGFLHFLVIHESTQRIRVFLIGKCQCPLSGRRLNFFKRRIAILVNKVCDNGNVGIIARSRYDRQAVYRMTPFIMSIFSAVVSKSRYSSIALRTSLEKSVPFLAASLLSARMVSSGRWSVLRSVFMGDSFKSILPSSRKGAGSSGALTKCFSHSNHSNHSNAEDG